MPRRVVALPFLLATCLTGAAGAQVSTSPLQAPEAGPPVASPTTGRQTGITTLGDAGGQQIIVRSYEPDAPQPGNYRLHFAALDGDGDGFINRAEAAAHPTLTAEFRAVDVNNDGRLSREELAGWMR